MKQGRNYNQILREGLFLVPLAVYLSVALLRFTVMSKYVLDACMDGVLWFCFVCLLFKEFLHEAHYWTWSRVIWMGVNYILFGFSWMLGGLAVERIIAFMFVFLYSAADVEVERILRTAIAVMGVWFCLILGLCAIGMLPNHLIGEGTERVRMCLGFTYALYPSTVLLNLTMLFFVLYAWKRDCEESIRTQMRKRVIVFAVGMFTNVVLYRLADARMNFVFCSIFLLLILVYPVLERSGALRLFARVMLAPTIIIFPVCAAGSLFLAKYYSDQVAWMSRLNRIFARRLEMMHQSLANHGYHLGVKLIGWTGRGLSADGVKSEMTFDYVDNLYLQIFQRYGLIVSALLLLVLTAVMFRCYRKRYFQVMLVMTLIALHLVIDDLQFYLEFNSIWLLTGPILLQTRKKCIS